ncbi:MAG: Ig-like domain-containing protein [Candidatus Saccharimonadales bacterium]
MAIRRRLGKWIELIGLAVLVLSLAVTTLHPMSTRAADNMVWTSHNISGQSFLSLTSTADGQHLAAGTNGGYIYTSDDYGTTWTQRTSGLTSGSWFAISYAPAGNILYAGQYNGDIYSSTNYGASWTDQTGSGHHAWVSMSASNNGYYVAAIDGSNIFTSSSYGATWTQASVGSQNWESVAYSANAGTIITGAGNGEVYVSNDYGQTWNDRFGTGNPPAYVSASSDGQKLATTQGQNLYTSTNGGATWTASTHTTPNGAASLTSSADGTRLAESTNPYQVYTSYDSGANWTLEAGAPGTFVNSLTSSADGIRLAGVSYNSSYIYTAQHTVSATPTPATPANVYTTASPTFSWAAGSGSASPSYTVQWSKDSSFASGVTSQTSSSTSYAASGFTDGTWYWRVKANDAYGLSTTWTAGTKFYVDTDAPTTPGKPTLDSANGTGYATNDTRSTQPLIDWTGSTDSGGSGLSSAAPYTLQWSQDSNFGSVVGSSSVSALALSPPVPLAEGVWYFRIVATDNAGNTSTSPVSDAISIDKTNPSAAGKPIASNLYQSTQYTANNSLTWSWTAGSDSGSGLANPAYKIVWSTNHLSFNPADYATTNSLSFTQPDAVADGWNYAYVFTYDKAGNWTNSTIGSVYVDSTPPTTPGKPALNAPGGTITMTKSAKPTLYWTSSSDSGLGLASTNPYTLQWSTDSSFTTVAGSATTSSGVSQPTSNLADGTWYFRAIAVDQVGNTATSPVSDAIVVDSTAPSVPQNVQTDETSPSKSTVTHFNWSASTDSGSGLASPTYTLQWCKSGGGCTTATTDNTTMSEALTDGTYSYKVMATDVATNSSAYSVAGTIVVDTTDPGAPGAPTVTSPTKDSTPTFYWTAVSDSGSGLANPAYTLELSKDSSFPVDSSTLTTTTNSLNFTPASDLSDGTWYVRVTATDQAGNTKSSSVGSVLILALPPIFSDINTTPISDTNQTITWSTDSQTSSQVMYGPSASYGGQTAVTDTSPRVNSHSVDLSGLLACTTYHFQLASIDVMNNSNTSSDGNFTTSGCAGSSPVITEKSNAAPINTDTSLVLSNGLAGATVDTPSGYTTSDTTIQIKQLQANTAFDGIGKPGSMTAPSGNNVYDIKALLNSTTPITVFAKPITITLSYDPADVANLLVPTIAIYRWDSGTGWAELDNCQADSVTHTVSCTTTHFSTFAVFGTAMPVVAVSTPNPATATTKDSSNPSQASNNNESAAGGNNQPEATDTSNNKSQSGLANTQNNISQENGGSSNQAGKSISQKSNNSLGLGWWWLPIIVLIGIAWLFILRRHRRQSK